MPRALAEVNRQWYSKDPLFQTISHSSPPSPNHCPLYHDHDQRGHEYPHDNHQGVARQHLLKMAKAILVIVSINMVIIKIITMITILMIIIRVARQRVPKVAKGPNVLTPGPLLLPALSSPWSSYHHRPLTRIRYSSSVRPEQKKTGGDI